MSFDSEALAQLAAGEVGAQWLVEMDFSDGTQRITTLSKTVVIGGHTYLGFGGLLTIGDLKESQQIRGDQLSLTVPLSDSALIPLVLGNVEGYRGRDCRLYLQLFDATHQPAGNAVLRFTGRMQPVSLKREKPTGEAGDSTGSSIEMVLVRAGLDRSRKTGGRKLTDSQQRAEHPGDTGLRYVRTLVERPTLWLSREFQKQ
ncbi:MAG: hypothetical protein YHS30scaffold667_14 [Phage 65_10]|nr:MAG: hypothetical protein YHS30scaffold667_14 [Phage 65_10]